MSDTNTNKPVPKTEATVLSLTPKEDLVDPCDCANNMLEEEHDKAHDLVLLSVREDGHTRLSYTAMTTANMLFFAEVLRKEALDLMYPEEYE